MPELDLMEARAPIAAQGEGIKETLTHGAELRIEEDRTSRALLAAILRELKKMNFVLAEAFKSELGRREVADEDVEER
jgi:hypothetical protein